MLVCREQHGRLGAEIQIPVELITISEKRRFNARRLIAALLALLVSIVVAAFLATLSGPEDFGKREPTGLLGIASMIVFLGGFLAFCVLLASFFFRAKTVCLSVAPDGRSIEFWKRRKYAQAIDALLEQIRQEQRAVEATALSPAKGPTVYVDPPSLTRRFIAYLWLSVLPALITGQPRLFLLVVFPVTWYVVRQSQYLRQPVEYRRAVRCYRKKKWNEAIELLTELLDGYPDYLPAYVLLVYVHTRAGRYDDALGAIARYGDPWPDISQDLHTTTWHYKRVGKRREDHASPAEQSELRLREREICE